MTDQCDFFKSKNRKIHWKKIENFNNFTQNIACVYTLEPPCRGGSNEYPQSMLWIKNRKIVIPLHTPVFLNKSWVRGVYEYMSRTCYPDVSSSYFSIMVLNVGVGSTYLPIVDLDVKQKHKYIKKTYRKPSEQLVRSCMRNDSNI